MGICTIFDRALNFYSRELTFEERVKWFFTNYYETGMEYEILLKELEKEDLDNFEWYGEFINIPKYWREVKKN